MDETGFREWLTAKGNGKRALGNQVAQGRRIENHYEDLDQAFDRDRFEALLSTLAYSRDDQASAKPNPARFPIDGDLYTNLGAYRTTLNNYAGYRSASASATSGTIDAGMLADKIRKFALENYIAPARAQGLDSIEIRAGDLHNSLGLSQNWANVCQALAGKKFQELAAVPPPERSGPNASTTTTYTFNLGGGAVVGQLDRRALQRYHRRFLAIYPDFEPDAFAKPEGNYFEEERAYKDTLLALAREAIDQGLELDEVALGSRLLDILLGQAGVSSNLLGWRTQARVSALRKQHPGAFEAAAGQLARTEDIAEGIARFVDATWPLLSEGQSSQPYSESRNLPTMLAALIHPDRAYGINTDPVYRTARALTGDPIMGGNPLTSEEYARVLALAEELRAIMADDWGWGPRDLWDVQGFIWAVNRDDAPAPKDEGTNIMAAEGATSPTNLILYGPPGTGKTFTTAAEAVRLCEGEVAEAEVRTRYEALVEAGQIAFVTFHQSYAYEDFVEGLRPVQDAADNEDAPAAGFRLEPRRGIFREIAAVAEQARKSAGRGGGFDLTGRKVFKMSLGRAGIEDHIYDAAIDAGYVVLGWGGDVDWSDPAYDSYQAIHDKWNDIEPGTQGNSGHIAQVFRFRSSMREGDLIVVSQGNTHFRAIGEITSPYRFDPTDVRDYNHRRDVNWLLTPEEALPVETIYGKPFIMWSCYKLKDEYLKKEALARLLPGPEVAEPGALDQFVLIIDEINRANISKVFGELITLLEADKRLGAAHALRVKLPYSGERFGIPPNLHIIGTMNTADRSIALLDTALRRRFEFRELMPEPDLLAEDLDGVPLRAMLSAINERIEYLFDREHQIGHAYFMGCGSRADIDAVMRGKVIPLLAEYFYEDWGKVALVFGDAEGAGGFLERVELKPPGLTEDAAEPRYRWRVRSAEEGFAPDAYTRFA